MKIKWWFFYYHTATVADMDIYHIKDLEDYGDIVLKNIYPLYERGIAQGLLQASKTYNCFTTQAQTAISNILDSV